MKNELGFSTEYEMLQVRRECLRGECAEEIEAYMHLTMCVGPNLKAEYMLHIGQLEHRIFQLKSAQLGARLAQQALMRLNARSAAA